MRKRTRLLLLGASQASTLGIATPVPATEAKTRLDGAVREGKLTRAEADAVLKAIAAGIVWLT